MLNDWFAEDGYRRCVGIMLLNAENKIFVGKRIDDEDHAERRKSWQMPQGGVNDGEDVVIAAYRELYEETGINQRDVSIIYRTTVPLYYKVPTELAMEAWGGKYVGQKQLWFLLKLRDGFDIETINLQLHEPEFSTFNFFTVKDLIDNAVDFKKDAYKKIAEELYLPYMSKLV
jgi:putative (di)nucleoside polyphosphate hydrolase